MGVRVEASSKCSLSPYQHRHYAATEHDHGDVGGGELASGGEGEVEQSPLRFLVSSAGSPPWGGSSALKPLKKAGLAHGVGPGINFWSGKLLGVRKNAAVAVVGGGRADFGAIFVAYVFLCNLAKTRQLGRP